MAPPIMMDRRRNRLRRNSQDQQADAKARFHTIILATPTAFALGNRNVSHFVRTYENLESPCQYWRERIFIFGSTWSRFAHFAQKKGVVSKDQFGRRGDAKDK
jgi:hypothetical protein